MLIGINGKLSIIQCGETQRARLTLSSVCITTFLLPSLKSVEFGFQFGTFRPCKIHRKSLGLQAYKVLSHYWKTGIATRTVVVASPRLGSMHGYRQRFIITAEAKLSAFV